MQNMTQWACLVAVLGTVGCVGVSEVPEPTSRVVLVIDVSGSYRNAQAKALQQATQLLETMAETKQHRWQKESVIALVSLDALPEVVWRGGLRDLKANGVAPLVELFRARADLDGCTDVETGFRVALRELGEESRAVSKYLIVFSDLVHEPPEQAINRCSAPQRKPTATFPFEQLRDVSVSVFWVPPATKLVWSRALVDREMTFALYTASESRGRLVPPPPPPTLEFNDTQRAEHRRRVLGSVVSVLKTFVAVAVCLLLTFVGLAVAARQRRARRNARALTREER